MEGAHTVTLKLFVIHKISLCIQDKEHLAYTDKRLHVVFDSTDESSSDFMNIISNIATVFIANSLLRGCLSTESTLVGTPLDELILNR